MLMCVIVAKLRYNNSSGITT